MGGDPNFRNLRFENLMNDVGDSLRLIKSDVLELPPIIDSFLNSKKYGKEVLDILIHKGVYFEKYINASNTTKRLTCSVPRGIYFTAYSSVTCFGAFK